MSTLWYNHVFIDLNWILSWAIWPMDLLLLCKNYYTKQIYILSDWCFYYELLIWYFFYFFFGGGGAEVSSHSRMFHYNCRWMAANLDLCSALMAIEQWGFFSVPHLVWHGASVYNDHLRRPVTLTLIAERVFRGWDSNTRPTACGPTL